MDYKKAYKNLVAKVKNAHLYAQTDSTKNVLEDILPELRESEDEKIIREMLEYFTITRQSDFCSRPDRQAWIAWLEKQKEKKFDFELIKQAWYMEGYKDREFSKESKWFIKTGDDGPKYEENPKYGQPLTKTQKPAEIDFEDWDTLGYICDIVRKHVRRDEEFNALDKWLTEHYVNQKPAEWSEEDEEILNRIIETLSLPPIYDTKACAKMVSWLKSLRPSWKPSDQDELMKLKYAGTSTKLD